MKRLLLPLLILIAVLLPTAAYADTGSTFVNRIWDSMVSTAEARMRAQAQGTTIILQEAERFFLGETRDITTIPAVRDVYKAMRVVGLLLLGFCTVISLSQLTEAGLMGESSNISEWMKRFGVAAFMTMGSIHVYALWIRVFNVALDGFRGYLDTHWTGPNDPTIIWTQLIDALNGANTILIGLLAVVMLLVLLVLWFLIGGIRVAELIVAVIIAPLVWPVYLIPSLEDIPKTAFRSFLGLNATLLIIVAMLRMAVRMGATGAIYNSVWEFIPSIAMLVLAIFLPTMIKRLVGQGNTGAGGLMTAAYMLAGLKGLSLASRGPGNKESIAAPPAAANVPQTPSEPSAYPIAPVPSTGATAQRQPGQDATWRSAPRQVHAGAMAARAGLLEEPWVQSVDDPAVIEMGRSDPNSNSWDTVLAVDRFLKGTRDASRPGDTNK